MKNFLLISCLGFCSKETVAQFTYFNNIYYADTAQADGNWQVVITEDGFAVFGKTVTNWNYKMQFRELDQSGVETALHQNSIETYEPGFMRGRSLPETSDGGYLFTGLLNGQCAMKYDSLFNHQWTYVNGLAQDEFRYLNSAVELDDGTFLCAGSTQFETNGQLGPDDAKIKLIKLSSDGALEWDTLLSPVLCGIIAVTQIYPIENNQFLVHGWYSYGSVEVDNYYPQYMMRVTSEGEMLQFYDWDFEYANADSYSIQQSQDEFAIAWTDCYEPVGEDDGLRKLYFRNLDLYNEMVLFDNEMEYDFYAPVVTDFIATPDSGFAICGYDIYLDGYGQVHSFIVKTDSMGDAEWMKWYYFDNDTLGWNKLKDLDISNDGGFIGTGDCNTNDVNGIFGGYSASWVLKVDACGDMEWQGCPGGISVEEALPLSSKLSFWPNPSSSITHFENPTPISSIVLHDILGNEVLRVHPHQRKTQLDISMLAAGNYMAMVTSDDGRKQVGKVVAE